MLVSLLVVTGRKVAKNSHVLTQRGNLVVSVSLALGLFLGCVQRKPTHFTHKCLKKGVSPSHREMLNSKHMVSGKTDSDETFK